VRCNGPFKKALGFTLLEVLTVVAIIGMLFAVLLPSLGKARAGARAIACRTNLAGILTAVHTYATEHNDTVVPSYNMHGVSGNRLNPLDGWGPILDGGGYAKGNGTLQKNPFVCPDTLDVAGASAVQTGTNRDNPRGYMDWPAVITLTSNFPTTIPSRGFDRVIRVGYWINGDNPIGIPRVFRQGLYFTGSVGYGPDPDGNIMRVNRLSDFRFPTRLIAFADGLYSGKQEVTRLGEKDSRIGYRHPGRLATANVGFADGHADRVEGDRFPRRRSDQLSLDDIARENLGSEPTIYSDPRRALSESP
jgi:prepilin-type processing-associated H-X9-DG protein/prepilin-type N-terminal cleavage/methylation domain-containing protein